MKTTNNTIFIAGRSVGIGLAYAKAFLARGNNKFKNLSQQV